MAWKPNRQNSKTFIKCDKSQNKCFNKLEILVPSLKTLWEPTPSHWACRGYGSTAFPRSGTQWPTITTSDWHRSPRAPQGIRKVESRLLLICVFSHAFLRDTSHAQPFLFTPRIQTRIRRVLNGAVKLGQGFAHLLCCNSHRYFLGNICQCPELLIEVSVTSSWLRKDSPHHHYRATSRTERENRGTCWFKSLLKPIPLPHSCGVCSHWHHIVCCHQAGGDISMAFSCERTSADTL